MTTTTPRGATPDAANVPLDDTAHDRAPKVPLEAALSAEAEAEVDPVEDAVRILESWAPEEGTDASEAAREVLARLKNTTLRAAMIEALVLDEGRVVAVWETLKVSLSSPGLVRPLGAVFRGLRDAAIRERKDREAQALTLDRLRRVGAPDGSSADDPPFSSPALANSEAEFEQIRHVLDRLDHPPHHRFWSTAIVRVREGKDGQTIFESVSSVPMFPVALITPLLDDDEDPRGEELVVRFKRAVDGPWLEHRGPIGVFRFHQDYGKYASTRGLPAPNHAKQITTAMDENLVTNRRQLKRIRRVGQVGYFRDPETRRWGYAGTKVILPGRGKDTPGVPERHLTLEDDALIGSFPEDQEWTQGLVQGGSEEAWLDAWVREGELPVVMLCVLGAFVPALMAPFLRLDLKPVVVDLGTANSRGKTTVAKIGLSVHGNPDLLIGTWNSTTNGIVGSVGQRRHSLAVLDDFNANTSKDPSKVVREVGYAIGNGVQKVSMNRDRTLRRARKIECIVYSTAESSSIENAQDGGLRARTVIVKDRPLPSVDKAEFRRRFESWHAEHYGWMFPKLVRWLVEHQDDADRIRARHRELVVEVTAAFGGSAIAARLAAFFAACLLAKEILQEELDVPMPANIGAFVELMRPYVEAQVDEADGPSRALLEVLEEFCFDDSTLWTHGGAVRHPPNGRFSGRWDHPRYANPLYLRPQALHDELARRGYAPREILAAWLERGWVKPGVSRKRTTSATKSFDLDGQSKRGVHILPAAFKEVGFEEDRVETSPLRQVNSGWNRPDEDPVPF